MGPGRTATNAIELTRELVRFRTLSPSGERECAEHVGRLLEGAGFKVARYEFAERRTSLIARLGGAADRPPLAFTGHLDTVPLGARSWTCDPFAADLAGGRLWGRGSSDMKSGVAAFVAAAIDLAPGLAGSAGLVLVITAGEETGCEGAYHLARLGTALGRAGALVVAEPTGNHPCVGHKGALWLRARTSGVTAHGSMPERGVNAVYKAARAVLALERFAFGVAPHPMLGAPTLNVGTIAGGLNVNSVPDAATVGIDIRTVPEQKHTLVRDQVSAALGADVALESLVDVEGVWTDPADPWMQEVFDVVAPFLGARPEVRAAPYFTDASVLQPAWAVPAVILGPGEMQLAHQTDEYCLVERIEQAVAIYTELARRWCRL